MYRTISRCIERGFIEGLDISQEKAKRFKGHGKPKLKHVQIHTKMQSKDTYVDTDAAKASLLEHASGRGDEAMRY